MNMDEFHRQLHGAESTPVRTKMATSARGLHIVLSGPNAGVDVAFYASHIPNVKIDWFVSGGPAIVEGFANDNIDKSKITLWFNYLGDVKVTGPAESRVAEPRVGKAHDKQASKIIEFRTAGWRVAGAGDTPQAPVDFVVNAPGSDFDTVAKVFDDRLQKRMAGGPGDVSDVHDDNKRFTELDVGPVLAVGSHTIRLSILAVVRQAAPESSSTAQETATTALLEEVEALDYWKEPQAVKAPSKARLGRRIADADGSSLEIVGGQTGRAMGGPRVEQMPEVINSLNPTVLGNDQLTPSRSRADAIADYIPPYAGPGANLVTDDQQIIRIYLAATYPRLPAVLADHIVRLIIAERHDPRTGVRPGVDHKDTITFVSTWQRRLTDLNGMFMPATLRSLVETF